MQRTAHPFLAGPALARVARPARLEAAAPSLHQARTAERLALVPPRALTQLGARTLRLLRSDD
jgi:hypothetical protein